jgi:hypothetical protein
VYPSSIRYPLTYAFLNAVDNPYRMVWAEWFADLDKRRGRYRDETPSGGNGIPSALLFDEPKGERNRQ